MVITGKNKVSGISELLPLELPVPDTGAGRLSLRRNHTKLRRLDIFVGRDLGDGLTWGPMNVIKLRKKFAKDVF